MKNKKKLKTKKNMDEFLSIQTAKDIFFKSKFRNYFNEGDITRFKCAKFICRNKQDLTIGHLLFRAVFKKDLTSLLILSENEYFFDGLYEDLVVFAIKNDAVDMVLLLLKMKNDRDFIKDAVLIASRSKSSALKFLVKKIPVHELPYKEIVAKNVASFPVIINYFDEMKYNPRDDDFLLKHAGLAKPNSRNSPQLFLLILARNSRGSPFFYREFPLELFKIIYELTRNDLMNGVVERVRSYPTKSKESEEKTYKKHLAATIVFALISLTLFFFVKVF